MRVFLCAVWELLYVEWPGEASLRNQALKDMREKAAHVSCVPDTEPAVTVRRRTCGSCIGQLPRTTELRAGSRGRLWEEDARASSHT